MDNETPLDARSAFPREIDALIVTSGGSPGQELVCQFDDHGLGRKAYRLCLRRLAQWFTEHRQAFLKQPDWASLLDGPADRACIVKVAGLVEAVGLPGASDATVSEAIREFRKSTGRIWIFWRTMNMPLASLFSDEAKAWWVVYRLRREVAPSDLRRLARAQGGADGSTVTHGDAAEERFHELVDQTGGDVDEDLARRFLKLSISRQSAKP